jgi:hypothetical protein
MEFVVAGVSIVVGAIALFIIDRFQKRRWSQSIGQVEKETKLDAPLAGDRPHPAFLKDEKGESRPLARASM